MTSQKNNICNPTTFETDHTQVPLTCVAEKVKVPHWRAGRAVKIPRESLPYRTTVAMEGRNVHFGSTGNQPLNRVNLRTFPLMQKGIFCLAIGTTVSILLQVAVARNRVTSNMIGCFFLFLFFFFLLYKVILCFTVLALSPFFKIEFILWHFPNLGTKGNPLRRTIKKAPNSIL